MRSYTRHQLKEDKFAKAVSDQMHWTVEHRNTVIIAAIVLVAVLVGGYFAWDQMRKRDDQASVALGKAMRVYTAPLTVAGQAVAPGTTTFGSTKERSAAAQKEFQKVADEFPSTKNGKYALYLAGVSALDGGDSKKSEEILSKVAGDGDKDISTLAKFALASLYVSQNKDADAVKMYKDVIQADARTVPKTTAQLELAAYYETKNPAEAVKIYEDIQKTEEANRKANAPKESKDAKKPATPEVKTPLEEMAAAKIQQLKQTAR
ncbi:MAG TPA: tetratricopeptide repeat protein [Terriglobales bacterium]|nr:tetratricopeptide repeat protein [Terriglobales bacterium]